MRKVGMRKAGFALNERISAGAVTVFHMSETICVFTRVVRCIQGEL